MAGYKKRLLFLLCEAMIYRISNATSLFTQTTIFKRKGKVQVDIGGREKLRFFNKNKEENWS